MTIAIIAIVLGVLGATGAIAGSAMGKSAGAGVGSNSKTHSKSVFSSIWSAIKNFFSGVKPINTSTDVTHPHEGLSSPYESGSDAQEIGLNTDSDLWMVNPYGDGSSRIDMPNNGSGTYTGYAPSSSSAQANATTVPDAGSVAGHIEDSQNGGSAGTIDQSVDWIKQLLGALGLSSLFGNDEEHQWESYKDIVDDERAYGQGAINDARKWQEYMASTAYQRTVKDIEKAGLNPWLAVQSGSLSPSSWGSVDTGSALGSISTSLSQSLSNSNSNSSSAIIVALIMMLAKVFMS